MKNKFNSLLKTLGSCALITSLAVPISVLSSCTTNTNTSNSNDKQSGTDNDITYCYVSFEVGDLPGTKIIGNTKVKVMSGSYYAQVIPPTATCGGLKFRYWAEKVDDELVEVKPNRVINQSLTLYPVFENQILLNKCIGFTAIETTNISILSYENGEPITTVPQDLEVTLDYGNYWEKITQPRTITLNPGENVFFRGNNEENGFNIGKYGEQGSRTTVFGFSGDSQEDGAVNIGGSIMGLIDGGKGTATAIPNDYCFSNLFYDDPNEHTFEPAIKYVSSTFLPSETLKANCYDSLFQNQTTLKSAPELPAETLPNHCYNNLFASCSSLDYLKIDYTGEFSDSITLGWLEGVAATGKIIYGGGEPQARSGTTIPQNWTIEKAPTPTDKITVTCPETQSKGVDYQYVDNHPYEFVATVPGTGVSQDVTWASTNTSIASVNPSSGVVTGLSPGTCDIVAYSKVDHKVSGSKTITVRNINVGPTTIDCVTISNVGTNAVSMSWEYVGAGIAPEFKYSKDGKDWLRFWNGNAVSIPANSKIYLKGNNAAGLNDGTDASYATINFQGDAGTINLGGNIMGLTDDGRGEQTAVPCDYCFNKLFYDEDEIKGVSETFLPATTLSKGCYSSMFFDCDKLASVPKLEVPNLTGCDSCYEAMFVSCDSLTTTPNLPAQTLAPYCYHMMFYQCQALTWSSTLPATAAAEGCYQSMFQYCYSLPKAGSTIGAIKLNSLADFACDRMFYEANQSSDTTFNTSERGKDIFTCPNPAGLTEAVAAMFYSQTYPVNEPTSGQHWYFRYGQ
ncbi:MAG: Ig-like domain-containing protein [Mycoplasmoidaceae bacterium]